MLACRIHDCWVLTCYHGRSHVREVKDSDSYVGICDVKCKDFPWALVCFGKIVVLYDFVLLTCGEWTGDSGCLQSRHFLWLSVPFSFQASGVYGGSSRLIPYPHGLVPEVLFID